MKNIILSILAFLVLLSFDSTAQIIDDAPMDGLFAAEDLANKEPIPNPTIRRADVMWSKRIWREIDFRQTEVDQCVAAAEIFGARAGDVGDSAISAVWGTA